MHFSLSTVLLTLSASVASAAPLGRGNSQSIARGNHKRAASAPKFQTPDEFPLKNGFPNPNATATTAIEHLAGGTLSDAPPPPNPGPDGITSLQLIAFNELFEVAFFTDLIANITSGCPGYQDVDDTILDALVAIQAVSH